MDLIMNDLNFIFLVICTCNACRIALNLDPHMTCLRLVIVTA